MKLAPLTVLAVVAISAAYLFLVTWIHRNLQGEQRVAFRFVAVVATIALFFIAGGRMVEDHARLTDITKAAIAIVAAGCVFYEQARVGERRPVSERWKRFIGISLGIAAIITYFGGFRFGYAKYYHRHDQYHYYMGAKYFGELGYDGLYKCSAVAQDELGTVEWRNDAGNLMRLDMKKEVHHPDRKIRNLGGDNLLMPVTAILEHPEECKSHFTPERWEAYKADVRFIRLESDKGYWEGMQKDHGFNPPPAWTILGKIFSEMHPAGWMGLGFNWLQWLAMLDNVLIAGMFVALYWGFGWRVFAVGAVFWGCQSSAPSLWTLGAFLRQDWLFFLVLSTALARKRYFVLSGASVMFSGLLRIFPLLVVVGWVVIAVAYMVKHKRMSKVHQRLLLGGILAAAVVVPISIKICGKDSYKEFYQHTLQVHDRTPLTNHMGLRVLISHKLGSGPSSGRMKYVEDSKLVDPFEVWKRMRNERYDKYKYVAYAIIAASLAFFAFVVRRIKSTWIAACLGQIFIILGSQLTCYYYSFMVLLAPLTKVRRQLEVPLLGFTALTQFVWMALPYNDDKYTGLTLISLLFCYGAVCLFAPKGTFDKLLGRGGAPAAASPR